MYNVRWNGSIEGSNIRSQHKRDVKFLPKFSYGPQKNKSKIYFCQTVTLQNISDVTAGVCLPAGHDENISYDV